MIEDMIMKCESMEELERIKKLIIKLDDDKKKKRNCKHSIVYYLDDSIEYQETNYKFLCLECNEIVEGGKKKIFPKSYLDTINRKYVAQAFSGIYDMLSSNNMPQDEIDDRLTNFQKFLDCEHILDNINNKDKKEIEKLIIDSYDAYSQVKKLINNLK